MPSQPHREHHEYQLYLAVEDIDHSKTKAKRPQSNGICEGFHKTMQTFLDSIPLAKEKMLNRNLQTMQELA